MQDESINILKVKSKDWLENSIVSRTYPPSFSHSIRKKHGGIKPPELMLELIYAYGQSCQNIIDPFAGVGSTLIAASLLKKEALGIDLNPEWESVYNRVCKENDVDQQKWITGDSQKVMKKIKNDVYDLLITDVPYFSMDKLKQTRGKFSKAGENTKEKLKTSLNLFNNEPIPTFDEWKLLLINVFREAFRILKKGSFLVVFIGDMYRNLPHVKLDKNEKIGQYLLLSNDLAEILTKLKFLLVNELIWMDNSKKLGIYGYPFTWIPSLVDQRVLILKK